MDVEQMTSSIWRWTSSQTCQVKWEIRKTKEYVSQGTGRLLMPLSTRNKEWMMQKPRLWGEPCILEAWTHAPGIEVYPGHKQYSLFPGRTASHPPVSVHRGGEDAEMVKILTELECHSYSSCLREPPLSLESALGTRLQAWKGITLQIEMIVKSRQRNQSRKNH